MMATQVTTPGVYIKEVNTYSEGISSNTSIPVFIGFTETPLAETSDPQLIHSIGEYESVFGFGPGNCLQFNISKVDAGTISEPLHPVLQIEKDFLKIEVAAFANRLYHQIKLYFQNGGSACYILSIGDYHKKPNLDDFIKALKLLERFLEPSIVVIPDAIGLSSTDYGILVQAQLEHCEQMQNRITIIDVPEGAIGSNSQIDHTVGSFRDQVGKKGLQYGAAYFPWIHTGIVQRSELNFMNFSVQLFDLLEQSSEVKGATRVAMQLLKNEIQTNQDEIDIAHRTLLKVSVRYGMFMDQALQMANILSPSGTITGTFLQSEIRSGISKAPVNITLSNVLSPVINLTDAEQIRINHDDQTGISVNVLRAFPMKGVVSWSAKTLDGNSTDFRYINVRRTVTMIERTIKDRLRSFVFDPNNHETWVKAKGKVDDFLTELWRSKVLNGNEAHHAFFVKVGLNETMTAQDILDGMMRVQVGVAISRPAEFIIISFEQAIQH